MASKKLGDGWGLLLGVVGTAVVVGGFIYLATGAGSKKNSPFIPDPIEDELDKLVDALTKRFGDKWIKVAEHALMDAVPLPLRPLIKILINAQTAGAAGGWDWPQTRAHAAKVHKKRRSAS